MTRDPDKFLLDMLNACRFLIEFTASATVESYVKDRVFRDVVERELQNIGEAMFQLQSVDPKLVERITEHARIIRFRHVLVDGYHKLDPDAVWKVVKEKVPQLQRELEAMLP